MYQVDDYASSTTCTAPANPDNGAYSGSCAAGSTLYSGNRCTPTCDEGYTVSGVTTCVAGTITTTATCVSEIELKAAGCQARTWAWAGLMMVMTTTMMNGN
jgi:hypothetical protein